MNPKNITILVYLHNNSSTVDACLNSIIETTDESMRDIIVIDDGSTDDSLETVSNFENIKISSHEFWGITRSINEQLPYIDNNDVIRINADVVIKSQDWLEKFQSTAYGNKEIGIVGARLLLPDNRIETDGRNFVNGSQPKYF